MLKYIQSEWGFLGINKEHFYLDETVAESITV